MLSVGFHRRCESYSFNIPDNSCHLLIGEQRPLSGFDEANPSATFGYVFRHRRLESAFTDKSHDRVHLNPADVQQVRQSLEMPLILVKRILKSAGVLVNLLCPGSLIRASKYPPLHVFRFNDKDAVG